MSQRRGTTSAAKMEELKREEGPPCTQEEQMEEQRSSKENETCSMSDFFSGEVTEYRNVQESRLQASTVCHTQGWK